MRFEHFAQRSLLRRRSGAPQSQQPCACLGISTAGTSLPLTARLVLCVRRVAIALEDGALEIEFHNSCATYSAKGATNLRHLSTVSQSLIASEVTMRQLPSLASNQSDFLNGSVCSQ